MEVTVVGSIVLFALLVATGDSKCVLPQMEKPINWNMLPGTWYHMQNTRDPVTNIKSCYAATNMRGIPGDGLYLEFREISSVSDTGDPNYVIMPKHWVPVDHRTNAYRLDVEYEYLVNWNREAARYSAGSGTKNAAKAIHEIDGFYHIPYVIMTDYKHFWVALQCVKDERYIWSYSRHPRPSDEEMLRVKEALSATGNGWDEVPLYPSGCAEFNIRDPIIN